jgi:RNA polymerase sigma factor (TIGR02999 family)
MSEVTHILSAIDGGEPQAADRLLPLFYDELRRLAAQELSREAPGQTFQATALVHEAYVRLVAGGVEPAWDGWRHFFAAAAEAMRRILIDRDHNKRRLKRGGGWRRLRLDHIDLPESEAPDDFLALDDALQKLAREDTLGAELVKLRFFAGLTLEEAANALGLARRTVDRYWAFARSWLYDELRRGDAASET